MKRGTHALLGAVLGVLLSLSSLSRSGRAQVELDTEFKAGEAIETIVVKLEIGPGADLQEPIALDLGLGFPLWLHSIGRKPDEIEPFGAVAQQVTAEEKIKAGESGTFTFSVKGDSEHDVLGATRQLLAGVRVGDIARVGFIGAGETDWVLGGYEIRINGKLFATSQITTDAGKKAQEAALEQVKVLGEKITKTRKELETLQALAKAKLASAEDLQRGKELETQLTAALAERLKLSLRHGLSPRASEAREVAKRRRVELMEQTNREIAKPEPDAKKLAALALLDERLRAQLEGKYPWFLDETFKSPWRGAESIQTVKVTVETAAHAGADSRNLVYFRTGGRAYLLGSPATPITPENGPQIFTLDLLAGPLTGADLRGWALGMLGHAFPFGKTPDRWHPQRLLVEVDGRVVYDSEENDLDRRSLEVIRVIPPVHRDVDGSLVLNTPNVRETYVWEAGKGQGLDPENGEPLDLPDPTDPAAPQAEPGLVPPQDQPEAPVAPDIPQFPPGPWPGENHPGPGPGPGPVPGPGDAPPMAIINPAVLTVEGIPAGEPFQVKNVALLSGWTEKDPFKVEWQVSGAEANIGHFCVVLYHVLPEQADVLGSPVAPALIVPADQRSAIVPNVKFAAGQYFVAPHVTAFPNEAGKKEKHEAHSRLGAARAVFPVAANPAHQPAPFSYLYDPAAGPGGAGYYAGALPAGTGRAAWIAEPVDGHHTLSFVSAKPGLLVGVRPEAGDVSKLLFQATGFSGPHRLVSHLGFQGGAKGGNTMDVTLTLAIRNASGGIFKYPDLSALNVNTFGSMPKIERVVDSADVGGSGPFTLDILFTIKGGHHDPAHPPGLFGLRLVPEASAAPPTVKADLAISKLPLVPGTQRFGPPVPPPVVEITNNGPDAVPASLVSQLTLRTMYAVGQWGKDINDAQEFVVCFNQLPWSGPFKVGDKVKLTPTHPTKLPGGVFTSWTKFFGAKVDLMLPTAIDDPKTDNNTSENYPPAKYYVFGNGPGPYEVLCFYSNSFQPPALSFEYRPGLRHKLFPYVGDDGKGKIQSIHAGAQVQVALFKGVDFRGPCEGGLTGQHGALGLAALPSSLIVSPHAPGKAALKFPFGVFLEHQSSGFGFDPDSMFYPLPENPSTTSVGYAGLGPLNNYAEFIYLSPPKAAPFTTDYGGHASVILFDLPNFQGATRDFPAAGVTGASVWLGAHGFDRMPSSLMLFWMAGP